MYRHIHGQAHHSVGHIYRYVHAHGHPIDMYTRRMTPKDMCTHRVTLQICTRIWSPSDVHAVTPQTCTRTGSPLRYVHAQYILTPHTCTQGNSDMHTDRVTLRYRDWAITGHIQTCTRTGAPQTCIQTASHLAHEHAQGHPIDMYQHRVTPRACGHSCINQLH